MTKERFFELQMAALQALRADMEEHMKNPTVLNSMRDGIEHKYKAILDRQAAWESGSFWTVENEKKYNEHYKEMEA